MSLTRPTPNRPEPYGTLTHPPRLGNAATIAPMLMPAADGVGEYFQLFGAESGYNTEGDVLVNRTSEGTDLNQIFSEFVATLNIFNQHRSALTSLLSYPTTRQIDAVPQSVVGQQFERASEFGVPNGARMPNDLLKLAYDFEDYDIASRFTWKYLRDADARQVEAVHASILEAANRLMTTDILRRLFDPADSVSPEGNRIYGLYNGDGMFIPSYMGREFDPATDTHYLTSGAANIDASDVEALMRKVSLKGFGADSGRKLLVLVNPDEADEVARFRAGETQPDSTVSSYDFIPSAAAPPRLTHEQIVGEKAPAEWGGLPVLGSYGPAYVISSAFMPRGYVAIVASAGPNAAGNPIGLRSHVNPAYQGLRIIPGRDQRYPLIESFYSLGFGTGTRHRGGAAVMQITTATTYTPPVFPK